MKKVILAGILFAVATTFAPLAASAEARSPAQQQTGRPLDAFARDASTYGGQLEPRRGMRMRSGPRSRMMMMRNKRMMMMRKRSMKRDPSTFGGQPSVRMRTRDGMMSR